MKKFVSYMILKIKKRKVNFHEFVTTSYLFYLILEYCLRLFRGVIRLRKSIFIGRSVILKGKHNIHISKGVVIGNMVELDGLGRGGLKIGEGSSIGSFGIMRVSGSLIHVGEVIDIGRNVGIGDFFHVGGAGGVYIGDDTIIGPYFSTHPENHIFSSKDLLIREQGVSNIGIHVGRNCWIGAKVTILDGSYVGDGCVIAAGAVVKGKFPSHSVIGGVPARVLKTI